MSVQEVWTDALASHFNQAKLADVRADRDLRPIPFELLDQAVNDLSAVVRLTHIDKVDDDNSANVAELELAGNVTSGL